MDIFRLPVALRRSIILYSCLSTQIRRYIATQSHNPSSNPDIRHASTPLPKPSTSSPINLSPATINSYVGSVPPNTAQLRYAASFFQSSPPELLYSATHFRSFPPSSFPEVAFLGRSNVGKSSLLNALFGRPNVQDAHVSKRPGRTKTMNGFGVTGGLTLGARPTKDEKEARWKRFPQGGLVVIDMPGYGSGSRELWGEETLKYLSRRKQLRRTFVLVDAEHGLKVSDITILTHLRRSGIQFQVVLSKVDKLLLNSRNVFTAQSMDNRLPKLHTTYTDIRQRLDKEAGDGRQGFIDILCCSAEKSLQSKGSHKRLGVDELRWAVLSACGMESDELGQRKKSVMEDITILGDDDATSSTLSTFTPAVVSEHELR